MYISTQNTLPIGTRRRSKLKVYIINIDKKRAAQE